jgi:hypothetical protein
MRGGTGSRIVQVIAACGAPPSRLMSRAQILVRVADPNPNPRCRTACARHFLIVSKIGTQIFGGGRTAHPDLGKVRGDGFRRRFYWHPCMDSASLASPAPTMHVSSLPQGRSGVRFCHASCPLPTRYPAEYRHGAAPMRLFWPSGAYYRASRLPLVRSCVSSRGDGLSRRRHDHAARLLGRFRSVAKPLATPACAVHDSRDFVLHRLRLSG